MDVNVFFDTIPLISTNHQLAVKGLKCLLQTQVSNSVSRIYAKCQICEDFMHTNILCATLKHVQIQILLSNSIFRIYAIKCQICEDFMHTNILCAALKLVQTQILVTQQHVQNLCR